MFITMFLYVLELILINLQVIPTVYIYAYIYVYLLQQTSSETSISEEKLQGKENI